MVYIFSLFLGLLCFCGGGDTATPSLTEVVPPDAAPTKLNTDITFTFTEGPVVDKDGNLYFSDMDSRKSGAGNRTMKMTPDGEFSEFLSFYNGNTNGLLINRDGNILACEMYGHRVVEVSPAGEILRVVADSYQGKRLDGPNDMVMDRQGGLYITDPRYIPKEEYEQDTEAVYYLPPGGTELIRVIEGIEKPNGILLSPDETILYINNTMGEYIYAYDVRPDGTLQNRRAFARLELPERVRAAGRTQSGADGMALDVRGNLYVTTALGVQVVNADGENLGVIPFPEVPANCGFGGPGNTTLYVTARTSVYSIDLLIPGLNFPQ